MPTTASAELASATAKLATAMLPSVRATAIEPTTAARPAAASARRVGRAGLRRQRGHAIRGVGRQRGVRPPVALSRAGTRASPLLSPAAAAPPVRARARARLVPATRAIPLAAARPLSSRAGATARAAGTAAVVVAAVAVGLARPSRGPARRGRGRGRGLARSGGRGGRGLVGSRGGLRVGARVRIAACVPCCSRLLRGGLRLREVAEVVGRPFAVGVVALRTVEATCSARVRGLGKSVRARRRRDRNSARGGTRLERAAEATADRS
ncbi:hypothetical protein T492DRAFT_1010108 [Pavlovales sp. CCMP2436]|nr:hypothetical protein T492DRAFT_1010108 [Pavlovales sp. CCMP2436]